VEVGEIFDTVGGFIALGALLGLLLLVPLYLSQRRDIKRLHAFMEDEPDYAAGDLDASEERLDAAETELEEVTGATAIAVPEGGRPTTGEVPAATRVTHERPALERITMERAALQPHPRWRRFADRVTQPRVLVAIGAAALLLGATAIFVSQALLSDDERPARQAARIIPADVNVAVFNGTSINGLAGKVADDVEAAGFNVVAITNTQPGFERTEVRYEDGQKGAATKVSKDLGVGVATPLDRDLREEADTASDARVDVVVIAGEDRV
jgi:hypothetical protein